MLIKKGTQGTNYYLNTEIEKIRYNPYRKANRIKAELSYANNNVLDFPLHIIVETSSRCNLKCEFCNREKMTRKQMDMTFETFKKIADEASKNLVYSLSLYCLGEPLLNDNLDEMILYAKKTGIPYVDVSTNGMFDMRVILDTGLNELIISLDGFKETHEKLRKGSQYSLIERNIEALLEAKYDNDCIVRLQIIDLPETHNIIDDFINKWKHKVEVIYVKNLEGMTQNLGNKLVKNISEVNTNRKACKQLYYTLTVNADGNIAACCHDSHGKSILGNINEITLKEAWDKLKDIRQRHLSGNYDDFQELCKNCVDWGNW